MSDQIFWRYLLQTYIHSLHTQSVSSTTHLLFHKLWATFSSKYLRASWKYYYLPFNIKLSLTNDTKNNICVFILHDNKHLSKIVVRYIVYLILSTSCENKLADGALSIRWSMSFWGLILGMFFINLATFGNNIPLSQGWSL